MLVKQQKKNKLTTRFDTDPYVVVQRKGSQVIAVNKDQRKVKRNVSHFKRIPKPENWNSDSDSDDDSDLPSGRSEQREQSPMICVDQLDRETHQKDSDTKCLLTYCRAKDAKRKGSDVIK